jgi:hypothetical protein
MWNERTTVTVPMAPPRTERRGAALQAHLYHPAEAPRRAGHGASFAHHERQRLLHVHVLARLAGVDHLQRVPVIGGVDRHRVEVLQLEQLPVVLELPGLSAHLLRGEIEVGLVQVAKRHDLGVGVLEEGVEDLVAAIAEADEAHADAIACAEHAASADGRADPGRGRRSAKLPAGEWWHWCLLI